MGKYVFRRILMAAVTLLVIIFVLFLLLEFMPGTPFNDERLTADQKAHLQALYGLDRPMPIRFLNYIKNMLSGDFGISYSIAQNAEIRQLLKTRLPISLQIGGQAVLLGTALGLLLGISAAPLKRTPFEALSTLLSVIGVSLPSYVFALILSYYIGYKLGWFPVLYQAEKAFSSTVLPSISLSMMTMATITRFTKTEMLSVLNSEYMLFVQTKGLSGFSVIVRHALRNTLTPIITALAPLIVGLMTGSLMVEQIFSVPGLGSLLVAAIQANDYNVVITIMFIYSVLYIGIMLAVDLLYCVIDPRIRLSDGERYE
mgnify:CR=1 FL=1